jgi:hypothetical protein
MAAGFGDDETAHERWMPMPPGGEAPASGRH